MHDELHGAHWPALVVAVLVGAWAADAEPAQRVFTVATRSIGLAGPAIGPLALAFAVATTFACMAAAYIVVLAGTRLAAQGLRFRR